MAYFLNPTDTAISTSIDGYPIKAKPRGTCEVPDHKAWVVQAIGLPLVPVDKPAVAAEPESPPTPKVADLQPVTEPAPDPVVVAPPVVVIATPLAPAKGGKSGKGGQSVVAPKPAQPIPAPAAEEPAVPPVVKEADKPE